MKNESFALSLGQFIDRAPTPFHAVLEMGQILQQNNFQKLSESSDWNLEKKKRYWVEREGSLIAFQYQGEKVPLKLMGAHTDSPCLKVKPNGFHAVHGYERCGVEIYGAPLLSTWFDRDLTLAGRVFFESPKGIESQLFHLKNPIAILANLAIHLNREVNESRSIHKQTELPPLLALQSSKPITLAQILETELKKNSWLSADLSFCDTQKSSIVGLNQDFLVASRLDNLLSCYVGLCALVESKPQGVNPLVVFNDHEEVGSGSRSGASGTFLKDVLDRLYPNPLQKLTQFSKSFLISCDNAHAIHPNYADRHEPQHAPRMNHGIAIKINSNQRYATSGLSEAVVRAIAKRVKIPLQSYVVRTDLPCGSTIGPITATQLGIPTIDIGVPTLAMHSIRETAGVEDIESLFKLLKTYFSES